MFGEEENQPKGFEPAGLPETTSPEVQRNQLINAVDELDKKYDGKVVTRFPMSNSDKEVLIFNSIYGRGTVGQVGVHPDLGPIAVSESLGDKLENVKHNFISHPTPSTRTQLPKWEEVIREGDESAVYTIRPEDQEIWDQALQHSVTEAKKRIEIEQKQAQVLPQSLNTAMRLAAEVNSQAGSESAANQEHRPAPPAPSSEPQV